jgi:hypothetical protein
MNDISLLGLCWNRYEDGVLYRGTTTAGFHAAVRHGKGGGMGSQERISQIKKIV